MNQQQSERFPENLPSVWKSKLKTELKKTYFKKLSQFLNKEYRSKQIIFPKKSNILKAFQLVDFDEVKVVILGQDPYHGNGQAMGLSFAVPNELTPKPPSLKNIFKEIESDLKIQMNAQESDLLGWAEQGVLLLNTVLTVRAHQAFSHREQGWEQFTNEIISHLNKRKDPVIFILWGAAAQKKRDLITEKQHYFLTSPHPSPLSASRGFVGCKHFSKVNAILKKMKKPPIDWTQVSVTHVQN